MTAQEENRRRLIARLEQQLQQPDAFRRLVDRLPDDNAIHGLKIWGAMRGLYPDTPGLASSRSEGRASHASHSDADDDADDQSHHGRRS